MSRRRKFDFTEPAVALTFVICALVIVGYGTLHYLGGLRPAPPIEAPTEIVSDPAVAPPVTPPVVEEQPQVLPVEQTDPPAHAQQTSPADPELR